MQIWKVLTKDFVLPGSSGGTLLMARIKFDPKAYKLASGPFGQVLCRRHPASSPPSGVNAKISLYESPIADIGPSAGGLERRAMLADISGSLSRYGGDLYHPFYIKIEQSGTTNPSLYGLRCNFAVLFFLPVIYIEPTYVASDSYPWRVGERIIPEGA